MSVCVLGGGWRQGGREGGKEERRRGGGNEINTNTMQVVVSEWLNRA